MVISVSHLTKYYQVHQKAPGFKGSLTALFHRQYYDAKAVDDISFAIDEGELVGFIGPNGAGKTTTINSIVGLSKITAGSIKLFGLDVTTDWRAARRLIGLAPQEYNFDRYLSIREILIYQAGYYGLRGRMVERRTDELLERFRLTSKAKQTYLRLSGGMKRRLTLARALVHTPELLILDEPTAGVDVELRLELWELLRSLCADGMTIVLTTHYLEEAQELCRNIAIIEGGRIVARESTARLLRQAGQDSLRVRLNEVVAKLPALALRHCARVDSLTNTLHFDRMPASAIASVLGALEAAGYTIADVDMRRSNLQDVFLELTRR